MPGDDLLLELVKTYVELDRRGEIRFPGLMAVTLAQWMLESGRGTSGLARRFYNFAGLKWRAEMASDAAGDPRGAARPQNYLAHDGRDEYCAFTDVTNFIFGYWRFIGRSPYRGFEIYANDPEGYIGFLKGAHYAADPSYVSKVLGLLPDAEALLASAGGRPHPGDGGVLRGRGAETRGAAPEPAREDGIYLLSGPAGRVEEWQQGALVQSDDTGRDADRLYRFLDRTRAPGFFVIGGGMGGSMGVAPEVGADLAPPLVPMEEEDEHDVAVGQLAGLRIALDAGHGYFRRGRRSGHDPGAVNTHEGIKEYQLNVLTVGAAAARLRELGAMVSAFIYDNPEERLSLYEKGRRADGHHLFISCHHNAAESASAQGTETLLHERSDRRSSDDEQLAGAVNAALVRALGLADRTRGRGYRPRALGVLTGANRLVQAKCLIEPFFISDRSMTLPQAQQLATRAGEALAEGVAEYWLRS